jgi:hypothetical protein
VVAHRLLRSRQFINRANQSAAAAGSSAHELVASVQSHFKLEETSGSRSDSVGTVSLNDINTVGSTTGIQGTAGSFVRASAEYLESNSTTALNQGDTNFSISGWVRPLTDSLAFGIASKYSGVAGQRSFLLSRASGNKLSFVVSADGSAVVTKTSTGSSILAGAWYFVVGIHDATNNTIGVSVNGGAIETSAHTTGTFSGTEPFRIGWSTSANYWNGYIDELTVFSKALSADDITYLYNGGLGRAYPFVAV